jgi:competence protein ComEA
VEQQSAPWRVFDAPAGGGRANGTARSSGEARQGDDAVLPAVNLRLALAAVVGAILIAGLAVMVAISGTGAGTIEGPEIGVGASPGDRAHATGEIVIDVAGAVVRPGLYRLKIGARIGDAIDAAGGFSTRVDVGRVGTELNLASTLSDGEQVRVPSRDDPTTSSGQGAGSGNGGSGNGDSGGRLVNINTATEAELDTLPGIGPVTAGKIIESRGGARFKTIDELRERGVVGEKTFEKLKPLISVG